MTRVIILIQFFLLILGLLTSCENTTNQSGMSDTQTSGNVSTTISTDINKLAAYLDFNTYMPCQVKFKYTFVDNSTTGERFTVPAPSDGELEAVIYYDSLTFQKILDLYKDTSIVYPNYSRHQFDFEWIDDSISSELLKSKVDYHGHPDIFLKTGNSGQLWLLHNKVLIYDVSN